MNRDALLALRDLVIEALELPPEEEATAAGHEALNVGLEIMFSKGAETVANRPRPAPQQRPARLALTPPADGSPYWTIFRPLPDKPLHGQAKLEPGQPFNPKPLNAGSVTWMLHIGANYIPAGDFEDVPAELEAEYKSGAIVVTPPGEAARTSESFLLLWSRARSIAFGQDKLAHGDAAKARPQVAAELARIAERVPASAGAMSESIKKLAVMFASEAPYTGAKNESPAEQKRVARLAAEAKRKARLAGDLLDEVELAGAMAAATPAAPRRGGKGGTNSFGAQTTQGAR